MTKAPDLTDRKALALARGRAARAPETFLAAEAALEISERLKEVNRSFTDPIFIGPMAEYWADALTRLAKVPMPRIVQDDPVLDLAPQSADLIVHGLSLHWADDPVGQLVQMRRALRPDGLMIAVLFGGQSLSELRSALAAAESALRGGLSPRVLPMADLRGWGALLQRAGFALPVADNAVLPVTYPDLFALIRDLRAMGQTNALAARDRRIPPKALFERAAAEYQNAFPADDGRIGATAELIFLTGWAPDPGQQKPLRPGSARVRLADALGTEEKSGGDPIPPRQS